jgi:hypothetical protein
MHRPARASDARAGPGSEHARSVLPLLALAAAAAFFACHYYGKSVRRTGAAPLVANVAGGPGGSVTAVARPRAKRPGSSARSATLHRTTGMRRSRRSMTAGHVAGLRRRQSRAARRWQTLQLGYGKRTV